MIAVRRIQFCAGHRVHQHESKCRNLHGHNYVAFFHAEADNGELDALGRVIDFSVLKARLGGWIDKHWDHGMILMVGDAEAISAAYSIRGQRIYTLPFNPTAENMAKYLLEYVCPSELAGTGVRVVKVVLWETENCFVEVSL